MINFLKMNIDYTQHQIDALEALNTHPFNLELKKRKRQLKNLKDTLAQYL